MEITNEAEPKHVFTTVTPFSKYLAMALFVLLPIVTLYIGFNAGAGSAYDDNQGSDYSSASTTDATATTSGALSGDNAASPAAFPWAKISQVPSAAKYYSTFNDPYNAIVEFRHSTGASTIYRDLKSTQPANQSTFVVGNGPSLSLIAKDKYTAYYYGKPISGVDVSTFVPLVDPYDSSSLSPFAKDAAHVYRLTLPSTGESAGDVVAGADPATFTVVGWVFAKDAHSVWSAQAGEGFSGLEKVVGTDPSTFTAVLFNAKTTPYFKDKSHVYWSGDAIAGADPATFVIDSLVSDDSCGDSVCAPLYTAHDKFRKYTGS